MSNDLLQYTLIALLFFVNLMHWMASTTQSRINEIQSRINANLSEQIRSLRGWLKP